MFPVTWVTIGKKDIIWHSIRHIFDIFNFSQCNAAKTWQLVIQWFVKHFTMPKTAGLKGFTMDNDLLRSSHNATMDSQPESFILPSGVWLKQCVQWILKDNGTYFAATFFTRKRARAIILLQGPKCFHVTANDFFTHDTAALQTQRPFMGQITLDRAVKLAERSPTQICLRCPESAKLQRCRVA